MPANLVIHSLINELLFTRGNTRALERASVCS